MGQDTGHDRKSIGRGTTVPRPIDSSCQAPLHVLVLNYYFALSVVTVVLLAFLCFLMYASVFDIRILNNFLLLLLVALK